MTKTILLHLVILLSTKQLFSQDGDYVKPDSKIHYNAFASFPSTRGIGYNIGIERVQRLKGNISFASSVGIAGVPINNKGNDHFFFFATFIQPLHIIAGNKKIKFESGVSISYIDLNLFNNKSIMSGSADKIFYGNLFIGSRYNPTEKIAIHLGYLPRYIIGGNKNYFKKFFHGLELSIFYSLN